MTIEQKQLKNWCGEENLVYLGTIVPEVDEAFKNFKSWLNDGFHAGMAYMESYMEVREHPEQILEGTKSVVVFAMPYGQGDKFRDGNHAKISQYARLRDYHKQMRRRGETIATKIIDEVGEGQARVVVDTAPVLERALAAQTGRGFFGKNSVFIHPQKGSFMFLGEIFLTVALEHDSESPPDPKQRTERGGCGTCRRCQEHCPTGALDQEYRLDANKCIAYWTIEHRGVVPPEHWHMFEKYMFGCDICQIVCPYNRDGVQAESDMIKIKERPPLYDIAVMDQATYESWFGGSPMTRAKREGLMRNALIAMHQLKDDSLEKAEKNLRQRDDCPEVVLKTMDQFGT